MRAAITSMVLLGVIAACGLAQAQTTAESLAAPAELGARGAARLTPQIGEARTAAVSEQGSAAQRSEVARELTRYLAGISAEARQPSLPTQWLPEAGELEAELWRPPEHDSGPLPRWIVHETVPRERISALALRYGVPEHKLRKWNGMSERGRLHPREPKRLKLRAQRNPPPRERIVHEVGPGEDWHSIAASYAVIPGHLRTWNKRELGSTLEPGERVRVWIDPLVYGAMLADHDYPLPGRAALIPEGAHSIGTPQAGRLVNGTPLPPGRGYEILFPRSAYGTTWAVRHLVTALDAFAASGVYHQDLIVGVMSRRRGGFMGGHVSHQSGRDVDIRLPVRRGVRRSEPARGRRVDWRSAWALARALVDSGGVKIILLSYSAQRRLYRKAKAEGASEAQLADMLQYPRPIGSDNGIIRHSPGHEGHFHVRFSCSPHEPECG